LFAYPWRGYKEKQEKKFLGKFGKKKQKSKYSR
jgi:hypothetical protein